MLFRRSIVRIGKERWRFLAVTKVPHHQWLQPPMIRNSNSGITRNWSKAVNQRHRQLICLQYGVEILVTPARKESHLYLSLHSSTSKVRATTDSLQFTQSLLSRCNIGCCRRSVQDFVDGGFALRSKITVVVKSLVRLC